MVLWILSTAAQAQDLGTTEAMAITALDHGAWMAGVGIAARGESEGLAMSAVATHVALLTTPVFLHDIQPTDPTGEGLMDTAWLLYWSGVGVTTAGWAAMGLFDDDGTAGAVLMTLGDIALLGSAGIAIHQVMSDRLSDRAVVFPVVSGTF